MNSNILRLQVAEESRRVLSNAREAVLQGEITQEQFDEIYASCYHAYLDALAAQVEAVTA